MRNLLLAFLSLTVLTASSGRAQDLTVSLHDTSGATADTTLPSSYQFGDTAVHSSSSVTLRVRDTSGYPVQVVQVLVSSSNSSANANPNFSLTGLITDKTLSTSSSSFEDVVVSFSPLTQGALTGYLQIYYQVANGCTFGGTGASACAAKVLTASTLMGNGTAPGMVLSYTGAGGAVVPQPNSATPLDFGNVSTSASASITFTLTNQSGAAITTPVVSLVTQQFNSSAFALDTSALPATLAAGATGAFTVTFAPGQTGLTQATLKVGTLAFTLQGTGAVVNDIDALQISYADSSGVRISPQAATPISFGQVVAGTNTPNTLNFTVTNPTTALNAITLQALTVTGVAFSLSSVPAVPLTLAPGASTSFSVVFAASAKGTYTGSLAIGTRVFTLSGSSVTSALPDATMSVDVQPLTSGQQAHLSIALGSASTVSAIGQLSMTFKPSVSNVTDDPAILFMATNGRQLQVNVASGAQAATYNGQSALTFQTGTTAGVLTFTLTFPNKAPITQSFTIAPAKIEITSATAVRQSPNLVVTVTGFDNTYTAGKMQFTFYDTSGNVLTPSGISVNSTTAFSQYFATSTVGGSFSMQANFPVNGAVTQVGSVGIQMTNSDGTTNTTESFQ